MLASGGSAHMYVAVLKHGELSCGAFKPLTIYVGCVSYNTDYTWETP